MECNFTLDQISGWGLVPYIQELGPNLVGCELGVKEGHNLRYLLDQASNIKMTYAVDPWKSYVDEPWGVISQEEVTGWKNRAMEVLGDYMHKVTVLEMPSAEAVAHITDNSLDYVFVDGDHSYEAVLRDVNHYWNKVKPGGIFAGHDWNLSDVTRAVTEFREANNINTPIQFVESNVWFWNKE